MSFTPKTTDVNMSRQIIFRLPEIEFLPLEVEAKQVGLKPNGFCRKLVIERGQRVITHAYKFLDPALIMRLDYIGQRLDDIAKNNPGDTGETAALRDEIYKIVMAEVEARVP